MSESAPKLFISYRREDTASHAGRLYDAMAARFGEGNVFMDIEIEPGVDFVDLIREVIGACQAFLVIIGPTWATLSNGDSESRIGDKEDYVRLEVETALRRRDVRVIPLLVGGARMPHPRELPEELRALTRRNALELSDLRWRYDVGRLMGTLEELLETGAASVAAGANAIEERPPAAATEVKAGHLKDSGFEKSIGAEVAGHRIEAIIGHGAMGVVYRARDLQGERVVALKVIAPQFAEDREFRQRFKRESRQAASIRHPNVLSIHRVGEEGNLLFITMDYVEGTDLRTFIGVRGRLDPGLAAAFASQVAAGLEAAHALGLVHGDVKPADVLIDGQEQAYLTGFGGTKRTGPGSALTKAGLIVGTTDYLAPELIEGNEPDARADVYALGCVLYEALTGFVPYPEGTATATMRAHVSDTPPSVRDRAPDVPMEFDIVVRRAMAKQPNQRFISAEAMRRAIDAAARGGPSRRGDAVVPGTASESRSTVPNPDAASQLPAPGSPADAHVASQRPVTSAEKSDQTRLGLSVATPAKTEAARSDADTAAPNGSRRNSGLRVAVAGLCLVVVVAAVLLLTSGGGQDSSTSNALRSAPAAPPLPPDLKWRPIRDALTRRQYAATTAVDGKVWIFGGIGRGYASTATQVYDPAHASWKTGPGLLLQLHHFAAVNYEGHVVLIGGFEGGDELDQLTRKQSDRVFELRHGGWKELPPLNRPRAAAAAAVVDGKIVVVGGQANDELVTQTEVFDGDGWKDMKPIPTPREHLAAASDGRYVYAIGGRELSSDKNLATLERYDPVSDSWTKLKSMPIATGGLGAAYVRGRLITVGGERPTSPSNAVWAYDIRTGKWAPLPNLPTARHGVAVTALGDSVYAVGGAAGIGHVQSTREAEVLNLSAAPAEAPETAGQGWQPIRHALFRRQYAASTAVRGTVWLLGGIGEGEAPSAKTAEYDRAIGNWAQGPELQEPLDHLMAVTYKGQPVVIGGFVDGHGSAGRASDRVYELRNEMWQELSPLNRPRAAAAAAVVDGKIVVVGGQANGQLVTQTEVYDGKHWKDMKPIPTPREELAAASDGRYLYAVGGRKLSSAKPLRTLERYDPVHDRWTTLPSMEAATGGVGAAYVRGTRRVIAVGGENLTGASNAVWEYDIQDRVWRRLPNLLSARHGVAVTGISDSVYAVGGGTVSGNGQPSQEAEVLKFDGASR
jgi:serine/threonine protein kinase/N-acetylneuraminic acid mutarotase